MRRVLLIADLEGVCRVDALASLVAGTPGHVAAQSFLTEEVLAVIAGLRAAGVDQVRISDSHRAGSQRPNVLPDRLPAVAELVYREDAYAPEVWDGVDAVACLGMHAAAGAPGFAAHTLSFHVAIDSGGRPICESDLVLGIAAERGIPVVFVSGDDVLARHLDLPVVVTKTAEGVERATSRPIEEVLLALREAAARPPVPSPPAPPGPWRLRWKSRWQDRLAGPDAVDGAGTAARYAAVLARMAPTEVPFARAIRTFAPGVMAEDVAAELRRGFRREPPPTTGDAATRALGAFLRQTDGDAEWKRASRALALQLLAGHAPGFFAAAGLGPVRARALEELASVPAELPPGLDPHAAMWRMDAAYVRALAGAPARLDGLQAYVRGMSPRDLLYAWLLWEMGRQIGLCPASQVPPRPLRRHARVPDLYWLTHLFFLETRYRTRAFDPRGWEAEIEEVILAVPWTLAERRIDLAGELAVCLQLAGEADGEEHRALIEALLAAQSSDGAILDPSPGPDLPDRHAHSTQVALLALSGVA